MITNFLKFKKNKVTSTSNVAIKENVPKNIVEESVSNPTILIEDKPYAISDFKQKKYKVFLTNGTDFYYLGDIRKFSSDNSPLSYLRLDNIRKVSNININELRSLTQNEIDSIKAILEYDSATNLMDNKLTYADKFEKELNIKVIF